MKRLIEIIENFKGKKIGVIGDVMLDHFMWGDVERISPEAPVPVVLVTKESFIPGGAANTASNIAALGGEVFLVGAVGFDFAGKQLISELEKRKINTNGLLIEKGRDTIQKIRVVARGQQLARVDKERIKDLYSRQEKKAVNFIAPRVKNWDCLVISDYNKGFITKKLNQSIIKLARRYGKPIVGDTKPERALYFKNVTLLSPNTKEAIAMAGTSNIREAGRMIQKRLNCSVLIKRGAEGMILFEKNKIIKLSTKAKEVFDVVGAGDTVAAVVSLALASGANLNQAAVIANHAAGIVVGKIGTATVSLEELKKDLEANGPKN